MPRCWARPGWPAPWRRRSCRRSAPSRAARSSTGSATTTSWSSTRPAATCSAWRSISSTASPRPDDVDQGRHGRPRRRRPLDRAGREPAPGAGSRGACSSGCPGSKTEVIWNDREGDRFVCHILDVKTRKRRTLPAPVYAVSPDARWAVAADFRRLHDTRPGYGYAGVPDPNRDGPGPRGRRHLAHGPAHRASRTLLLSVSDAGRRFLNPRRRGRGAKHWFNHLLVSPGRDAVRLPAPLARQGSERVPHAHDHRRRRRHGPARPGPLRQDVALHLARPAAHPRLGLAPVARRAVLPVRGPHRQGRGGRPRRDDGERPLHLPAGQRAGSSTTPIRTGSATSTPTSTRSTTGRGTRWAISARRRSMRASGAATPIPDSAPTAGRWSSTRRTAAMGGRCT